MRQLVFPALMAAVATLAAQAPAPTPSSAAHVAPVAEVLKLGDPMPGFILPDTEGQKFNGKIIQGPVLVMFLSTQCPVVRATEDRINALARTFAGTVAFIGINSNANSAKKIEDEGLEGMKLRATEKKYVFPYLKDESQDVARAFGALCTPDFFLFNHGKLVYHGRLDDNAMKAEEVTHHELLEAIESVEGGQAPNPDQVSARGCSIKWKSRK